VRVQASRAGRNLAQSSMMRICIIQGPPDAEQQFATRRGRLMRVCYLSFQAMSVLANLRI